MTADTAIRQAMQSNSSPTTAGVANSIDQKAMLVRVTVRRLNIERDDPALAREIATKHGSDPSMGSYSRHIIRKDAIEPIRKIADKIRDENYKRTLPWIDGGTRVLSSAGYFDYINTMRGLCEQYDEAVADFISNWSQYVAEAKVALNGLFRASEYPTQAEIGGKFQAIYRVYPFPASSDFRVEMSKSEADLVRANIEQGVREALAVGMQDVWARMKEVVSAMADRLTVYNPNGEKVTGAFRDSLVANVRDLVAVLPSLNVTDDPALRLFIKQMSEKLCTYDAQTLRDSIEARQQTARAAQDILDRMSAFV